MKLLGNNGSKHLAGQNVSKNYGDPTPPIVCVTLPSENETNKYTRCKRIGYIMAVFLTSFILVATATTSLLYFNGPDFKSTDGTPTTTTSTTIVLMSTVSHFTETHGDENAGETVKTTEMKVLPTSSSAVSDSTPTRATLTTEEITDDSLLITSSTTLISIETTTPSDHINSTNIPTSAHTTQFLNSTQHYDYPTSTENPKVDPSQILGLIANELNLNLNFKFSHCKNMNGGIKITEILLSINSEDSTPSMDDIKYTIQVFTRYARDVGKQIASFAALQEHWSEKLNKYKRNDDTWPWAHEWTDPIKSVTCNYAKIKNK